MAEPFKILTSVMATTHVDSQGEKFTKRALQSMEKTANGKLASPLGLDHDRTLPPTGKVLRARIEQRPDGELQLIADSELFARPEEVKLPDGTVGYKQGSERDARITHAHDEPSDEFVVFADPANFASRDDFTTFCQDVQGKCDSPLTSEALSRKSHVPSPELVITVAYHIVQACMAGYFGKKVLSKVGSKVSDTIGKDIDQLYRTARTAVVEWTRRIVPSNRPATYAFEFPGEPTVTLFAVTTNSELVVNALDQHHIEAAFKTAASLYERFGAVYIQFLLDEHGDWEFNYLQTDKGMTIGSRRAFSRRAKVIKDIINKRLPDANTHSNDPLLDDYEEDIAQVYSAGAGMSVGGRSAEFRRVSKDKTSKRKPGKSP